MLLLERLHLYVASGQYESIESVEGSSRCLRSFFVVEIIPKSEQLKSKSNTLLSLSHSLYFHSTSITHTTQLDSTAQEEMDAQLRQLMGQFGGGSNGQPQGGDQPTNDNAETIHISSLALLKVLTPFLLPHLNWSEMKRDEFADDTDSISSPSLSHCTSPIEYV